MAVGIVVQFRFRKIQVQHPVLGPPPFDGPRQRLHILDEPDHLACKSPGPAFENIVGLFVSQPRVGVDHAIGEFRSEDLALRVIGDIRRLGEPSLVGLQAADAVAEGLRQHRDHPPGQIHAVTPLSGFDIQGRFHRDKCAHIGDMHAQDPVAVAVAPQTDGIVEILGVRRIDRDDDIAGRIVSTVEIVRVETTRRTPGLVQALLIEVRPQVVLRQNRPDLRVVLAGTAENLQNDSPSRKVLGGKTQDFEDHLVADPRPLGRHIIDDDRLKVSLALGLDDPLASLPLQGADKPVVPAFEDLGDHPGDPLSSPLMALADDLGHNGVAVHRIGRVMWTNKQVALVRRLQEHDETEPTGVGPEGPRHAVGHCRQQDQVLGPDGDLALGLQILQCGGEIGVFFLVYGQFLCQRRSFQRRIVLPPNDIEDFSFQRFHRDPPSELHRTRSGQTKGVRSMSLSSTRRRFSTQNGSRP